MGPEHNVVAECSVIFVANSPAVIIHVKLPSTRPTQRADAMGAGPQVLISLIGSH